MKSKKSKQGKISKKSSTNENTEQIDNFDDLKTHDDWIEFLKKSNVYHRTKRLSNGADYRGETKKGRPNQPHGIGQLKVIQERRDSHKTRKIKNESEILYTGQFSEGVPHGEGIFTIVTDRNDPLEPTVLKTKFFVRGKFKDLKTRKINLDTNLKSLNLKWKRGT